ncbi:MAG: phosphatase PAP2 family protein [Candidatus Thorarchaeota archaeon]
MFFDPGITEALRNALPWAGAFFRAMTELGSELFYVALIMVGYWTYRKRDSIITAYVLLVSVVTNYWLKLAIANPRPDPSYWYPGVEATNYSTPSGHAQNSSMLFGWIALKARRVWMTILAVVLVFLIGISRVYLGVHYLGDVVLGWGIGIILVLVLYRLEDPVTRFVSRYRQEYLAIAMFLFGLVLMAVSACLVPQPPGDNFGALGGLIMGVAVAFPLEDRYVKFSVEPPGGQKWRLVLRVAIGFVIVIGAMIGLSGVLPSANVWLRSVRYFLVVLLGGFVWPAIFKRLNL